jgi:signal transduction histidine kinase
MTAIREFLKHLSLGSRILMLLVSLIAIVAAAVLYIGNTLDSELTEPLSREISVALVLCLILAAAVLFLFARGLSRRLGPLMKMANKAAQGELTGGFVIAGSDEFTRIGSAFNKLSDELRERDRVTNEFAAVTAQHLRDPASALRASLETLLESDLPAEHKKAVSESYLSNQRQLAFVDNLIAVVESDSGSLALTRSGEDLYQIVDEVVTGFEPVIASRQQRIAIKDPGPPIVLALDAPRIRTVLQNLITNASQYTQEGGRIDVALIDYGSYATVSVRDTGVGVTEEDQQKLFKKFSRGPANSGSGLGLYLANQIVKLHGGEIKVESAPGKGSRFTIHLPKAE